MRNRINFIHWEEESSPSLLLIFRMILTCGQNKCIEHQIPYPESGIETKCLILGAVFGVGVGGRYGIIGGKDNTQFLYRGINMVKRKYWFIIHNEGTIQFAPERIYHSKLPSEIEQISRGDYIVYYVKRIKKIRGIYKVVSNVKNHPLEADLTEKDTPIKYYEINPLIEPSGMLDVSIIEPRKVFEEEIKRLEKKHKRRFGFGSIIRERVALQLQEKVFRDICRSIVDVI